MPTPARNRRVLVAVAAVQLACGVAGMAIGIRRRHAYHVLFLQGSRDTVARDALLLGTALSAPAPMLVTQAVATTILARKESTSVRRVLGALGAVMVPGYLGEELVRRRFTRRGFDALESPLAAAGLGLSGVMAAALFNHSASDRGEP